MKCVIAAAWAWLIVAVVAVSNPDGSLFDLLGVSGVGIGFAWFFGSLFAEPGTIRSRWRVVSWLSVPAAPFLALGLFLTGWPTAARVWLCEEELKAHADRVLVEPMPQHPLDQPESQVGLFDVQMSSKWDGCVSMQTWGPKGHGGGGIVYAPNGVPNESDYRHLYGPWYRWGTLLPEPS